jgi:hypothetical protein
LFKLVPPIKHSLAIRIFQTQIYDSVLHATPDQELNRNVIYPLHVLLMTIVLGIIETFNQTVT